MKGSDAEAVTSYSEIIAQKLPDVKPKFLYQMSVALMGAVAGITYHKYIQSYRPGTIVFTAACAVFFMVWYMGASE
jgi:hypothetical protein